MLNDKILLLLKKKLFFYPKKAFYPKKRLFVTWNAREGESTRPTTTAMLCEHFLRLLLLRKLLRWTLWLAQNFMEFFSGSGEGCKSRGDTDSCYCGPCAHHEVLLHQQKQSLESLTSIGGYTNREYNITGSIDGDDNEVMSILRWLIEWNAGFAKYCSYGNGPGFRNLMTEGEGNFTQIDRANVTLEKNASAPLKFRQVFFMKESKEPKGPSWSRFFKQISIFLCQQRQQYC